MILTKNFENDVKEKIIMSKNYGTLFNQIFDIFDFNQIWYKALY